MISHLDVTFKGLLYVIEEEKLIGDATPAFIVISDDEVVPEVGFVESKMYAAPFFLMSYTEYDQFCLVVVFV